MSTTFVRRLVRSAGLAVAGLSVATIAGAQTVVYQSPIVVGDVVTTRVSTYETYSWNSPDRDVNLGYRVFDPYLGIPVVRYPAPAEKVTYLSYTSPAVTVYTAPRTQILTDGLNVFAVTSVSARPATTVTRTHVVYGDVDAFGISGGFVVSGMPNSNLDPFGETLRRHR